MAVVVLISQVLVEAGFSSHMRKAVKDLDEEPVPMSPAGTLAVDAELPGASSLARLSSQKGPGAQAAVPDASQKGQS